MERKIDRQSTYKKYKGKMHFMLFLLVIPAVLMLGSFLILYLGDIINMMHLGTLYITLLIGYVILVFVLAPKLQYNKMYANYSRLLINEPKLFKCNDQLYTTAWINGLKKDGYTLVQEDLNHMILCKHHKKLPKIVGSDQALVFLVIAKNSEFDFYGDEVDRGIQTYYMNHKEHEKVIKRITLQFKKYDMIDDKVRREIETIILYEAGQQVLINLSFAFDNKDGVFGLDPGNWYPNRYAYFAFTESKRICDIKE